MLLPCCDPRVAMCVGEPYKVTLAACMSIKRDEAGALSIHLQKREARAVGPAVREGALSLHLSVIHCHLTLQSRTKANRPKPLQNTDAR